MPYLGSKMYAEKSVSTTPLALASRAKELYALVT
jgi:hypothetical protein